tara:strand:- start:4261 stop:6429 length:2169 start_codon:yes stop_codon:yes gene_type:complete
MAVSHEIKSQLAKLLATEDLVVEHKKVRTAYFNVHTRVLTLPMWEKASNIVYDLLVGHEVGHALYTPDIDWSKDRVIPPSFVNIVEDARIEKMMKRKYAGLAKTFFAGYQQLSDDDFFEIESEDLDKMNLADRANLYFKIGNYIDIPFANQEEIRLIKAIANCESFDDVLNVSEDLYKYCKKSQENDSQDLKPTSQNQNPNGQQDGDQQQDREWFTEDESEENNEPLKNNDPDLDTPSYEQNQEDKPSDNEPEAKTDAAFDKNIEDLIDDESGLGENVYVELPQLDMNKIIVDYSQFHEYLNTSFSENQKEYDQRMKAYNYDSRNLYLTSDTEYLKFKKFAQKEVNYLVKEFECRKSASSYARATTARTGVLDCSKLHTYKYNEDLFKKVTTLADGKNHGLVFVLDWSGSMADTLLDTLKQLFNLIWFCKKTNIPFEVYAFTNNWRVPDPNREGFFKVPEQAYDLKDGLLQVSKDFNLLNMLSSRTKTSEFENCMRNIWRLGAAYGVRYSGYDVPSFAGLSGTPLNEAIISLNQILPDFKKKNKLEKVQCVVLTDGEAHPLNRHVQISFKHGEDGYIGVRSVYAHSTFLRDRKIGKTYRFDYGYHKFTGTLLNNLRDRHPDVNFIGIRVLAPREATKFMRMYLDSDQFFAAEKSWKKDRSFSMKNVGYTAYFGLSSNGLAQDTEFEVQDNATKGQIRNAFKKSLNSKKMNKKVLSEFISLVA